METITFLPASNRGNKNIGWLNGYQSFNFGGFYHPGRTAFGPLLVLNDDIVQPGTGFGKHAHENMEIISIPLQGAITHKDTTGTKTIISEGEVQIMSAGTGIAHSEFNHGKGELNFLQIWIEPAQMNDEPRYQQIKIAESKVNSFQQVVSPDPKDDGLWIRQSAWIHTGIFEADTTCLYTLKQKGNGLYIFLIEGEALIADHVLHKRDALKITHSDQLLLNFSKLSKILVIEVPV